MRPGAAVRFVPFKLVICPLSLILQLVILNLEFQGFSRKRERTFYKISKMFIIIMYYLFQPSTPSSFCSTK